jgi:predicted PurR-regulated permease PerM
MNKWTVGLLTLILTAFFVIVCFLFKKQNDQIKYLTMKISQLEKTRNSIRKQKKVTVDEFEQDTIQSSSDYKKNDEEFLERSPPNANDIFRNLLTSFGGSGQNLLHFTSKAMMPVFDEMGKKSAQIIELEQDDCDTELENQLKEIEDLISETEINE